MQLDRFWFGFFHEIAHIIKGYIGKIDGTTGDDEDDANAFAAKVLIPRKDFSSFVSHQLFTENAKREFAHRIGVHSGIVVGRIQKENVIAFNQMNGLKQRYMITQ